MNRQFPRAMVGMLVALALLSSCGSSASTGNSSPASDEVAAPEAESQFPVTIEHAFGETTIETEPERVVSLGFNEHDFLLALGVEPVGLREWYGDQPNGVWPWAQDELGDAEPEVLPSGDLNFEQIAALEPDVIVGVWSGMEAEDYELLAKIAPTVARPEGYDTYGTPWQEQTKIVGQATGTSAEAEVLIEELEAEIEASREEHPEWEGQKAAVAFVTEDGPGVYISSDPRSRILTDLGFEIPAEFDDISEGEFTYQLSPEDLTLLELDVVVWVTSSDAEIQLIADKLPTRQNLQLVKEGREIFAGEKLTGAFSHASPLSIDFVLEDLVPKLELATDGDPATEVPQGEAAGSEAEGKNEEGQAGSGIGEDRESQAAAKAWSVVFDSSIGIDEKAPHLAESDELAETVVAYTEAGDALGGISLEPTGVEVNGDEATITYDVLFGPKAAYSDQSGTIRRIDDVWVVGRADFCGFMSSARVDCPA